MRYRVTFPSGFYAEIANSRREYTHAWHAWGTRNDSKQTWHLKGFSHSEERALDNMRQEISRSKWIGTLEGDEVAPVERY